MCHMQHYDYLTTLILCTIMSQFAHIMHNPPGNRSLLRPLGFKMLQVFPICMKKSIIGTI